MRRHSIDYSNENRGYYVFVHEDNSPETSAEGTELEWDEEVAVQSSSGAEDEWSSLYGLYAKMLEQRDSKSLIRSDKERGAAHYAAEQGHTGVLRLLTQTECHMDTGDSYGLTPLHTAVRFGHSEATKFLIGLTSDVNRCTVNSDYMTSLHIAASHGHAHIIEMLISAGATIEARDSAERTPLHLAVLNKQINAAVKLLEYKSNCNVEDEHGFTPLCEAVWQGSAQLVTILLSAGARIPSHHYLLHYAVSCGQVEIVKVLIKNGAVINLRDNEGNTPLITAVRYRNVAIVRLLLENGAAVNYPNSISGSTALYEAVSSSEDYATFLELFSCLREFNVDMNAICFAGDGDTPLFRAIFLGQDSIARLLIKHGADVNLCSMPYYIVDNMKLALSMGNASMAHFLEMAGGRTPVGFRRAPLDLAHIVRIAIRSRLPPNSVYESIQRLPLPELLKKFLMFDFD